MRTSGFLVAEMNLTDEKCPGGLLPPGRARAGGYVGGRGRVNGACAGQWDNGVALSLSGMHASAPPAVDGQAHV